jgi:hypothetical protein
VWSASLRQAALGCWSLVVASGGAAVGVDEGALGKVATDDHVDLTSVERNEGKSSQVVPPPPESLRGRQVGSLNSGRHSGGCDT